MTLKKDLEKPEVGEEPKFIDALALKYFIENIDDAAETAFENPDEAVLYLKDFFTRNFGQNLPTQSERITRQEEAELKQKV